MNINQHRKWMWISRFHLQSSEEFFTNSICSKGPACNILNESLVCINGSLNLIHSANMLHLQWKTACDMYKIFKKLHFKICIFVCRCVYTYVYEEYIHMWIWCMRRPEDTLRYHSSSRSTFLCWSSEMGFLLAYNEKTRLACQWAPEICLSLPPQSRN